MFKELERKFGQYRDKSSLGNVRAGLVESPLPPEVYAKMSKKQWINCFHKYSKDRIPFFGDFLKGGIDGHSAVLKETASKNPDRRMIGIVRTILPDLTVPLIYPVKGLFGLAEGQVDQSIVLDLFRLLRKHRSCETQPVTIYILLKI